MITETAFFGVYYFLKKSLEFLHDKNREIAFVRLSPGFDC